MMIIRNHNQRYSAPVERAITPADSVTDGHARIQRNVGTLLTNNSFATFISFTTYALRTDYREETPLDKVLVLRWLRKSYL